MLAARSQRVGRALPRNGQVAVRNGLNATKRRTFATLPPPAPPGTPALPPPKSGRSGFSKFLFWTTSGVAVFYGGSTYAALTNQKYADFFTEKVPLGDKIYDLVEDSSFGRSLKSSNIDNVSGRAVEVASAGYERITDAVNRVVTDAKDKVDGLQNKGRELVDSDNVQQVRKSAKDMVKKVEKKVDEADLESKGKKVVEETKSKSKELIGRAKDAASHLEGKLEGKAGEAKAKAVAATKEAKEELQSFGKTLPLQHEAPAGYHGSSYRDRGVKANAGEAEARLRDPPNLPKLPKLAPSLSSLSGSEPMIAQLANTIDDLAAFIREAPAQAGIKAGGVLDEAKAELSKLYDRLEQVKKNEAAKLQQGLENQKKKYDEALQKAAKDAEEKVGKVDAAYKKEQEQLRKNEASEYAAKLKAELETQSHIINERLKEEVVQQGVEMQRRWMKEIKARVEAERGGRLAKLDQLSKDLDSIQKISLDNSQALEESATALALSAALRELANVALDEADEANVKRSFSKELKRVKGALKTDLGKDDVLQLAVQKLESIKPEEGVETFSSLYSWFSEKVRPAVQRVALVPDQAGVLSHLFSGTVAPLLFKKSGFPVEGEDVPSVLARTQYYLERRDLDSAARQLNSLKGWPKILAEDWLNAARRRLEVEQHLNVANAEAHLASLQNA